MARRRHPTRPRGRRASVGLSPGAGLHDVQLFSGCCVVWRPFASRRFGVVATLGRPGGNVTGPGCTRRCWRASGSTRPALAKAGHHWAPLVDGSHANALTPRRCPRRGPPVARHRRRGVIRVGRREMGAGVDPAAHDLEIRRVDHAVHRTTIARVQTLTSLARTLGAPKATSPVEQSLQAL